MPVAGIVLIGGGILIVESTGLSTASQISFILLTGSVFWMVSYILTQVNVLILRRRLPKAPRSFKVPFGPVLPVIGIIGTAYMILNISPDPAVRNQIWLLTGGIFIILGAYAFFWIKFRMKIPVFKSIPVEKVMAMENELYYPAHKAADSRPVFMKG